VPKDARIQQTLKEQDTLRPHNERLLINLIRTEGEMSKADLTRASGLSAQSATVIVNRLVAEGLLKAGKAVKGKVGQPSTPYSLNPEGVLSIGIKVGRRSLEVASMSFDYKIMKRLVRRYDFPHLETIRRDILSSVSALFDEMAPSLRANVIGIGIALPDDLSAWEATVGAPAGEMADWADADLANDVSEAFGLPGTPVSPISISGHLLVAALQLAASFSMGNTIWPGRLRLYQLLPPQRGSRRNCWKARRCTIWNKPQMKPV
jgi:hypothetical protein